MTKTGTDRRTADIDRATRCGGPDNNRASPFRPLKKTEARRGEQYLETKHMKDFRVDLKVCEGCGALWLRAADQGNYCRGCAAWLSEFPAPRAGMRRGRRRKVSETRVAVCNGGAR